MGNYVENMKKEHEELLDNIRLLDDFIYGDETFKTLNAAEQARMIKQSGFMEAYAKVLESRIWAA